MGDAYKGLTIRIGADTTSLDTAIRSVKTSAREAQTHLSRLNRALKLDPGNAHAVGAAMGLVGDKARLSAVEANRLQTAISNATDEVRKNANEFGDVYAETEKVKNNITRVDTQLQRFYDIAKRVKAEFEGMTLKEADKQVKNLQSNLANSGDEADRARREMERLIDLSYRSKDSEVGSLREKLGYNPAETEKMKKAWASLHDASSKYKDDLDKLNDAKAFVNAKNDMAAAEAELRQLSAQYARFKTSIGSIDLGEGFKRASNQAETFDRNIERARAALEKASAAADNLPKSVEAARGKLDAMKAASSVVADKMAVVQEKIDRISKEPGIKEMASDSRRVYSEMAKAESAVADLKEELSKAQANADELEKELDQAKQNSKESAEQISKMENDLDNAKHDVSELASQLERAEANARDWTLATELREANTEMDSLLAKSQSLGSKQTGGGKTSLNRFADSMKNVGYGLYSTVTPGVMMAGSYIVDAANDVDSAYRDMRKTVNGTEEQFEGLKDAAVDFSRTNVTSADTMLEIEAMGGQLGIATGDLQAFGETVSSLDIATNMSSEDIAEQLGKMASVMDINVEDYSKFGDALVRLGNNMPVMESDIMNMTTRWMGMGKVVGLSADQMLGWSAAASATGMGSEAAGSAMQRFVSSMENAVNAGGDSLEQFASVAGMSADEFSNTFKTDASGAMYSFIEGLGEIQNSGGSVNQVLTEMGFNNVRDKQLLEGLAQQMANGTKESNTLHDALQMSSDAYNGLSTVMKDGSIEKAGDAAREAGKKSEGFSGELAIMKNNLTAMALEMGDSLVPIMQDVSGAVQGFTQWLGSIPDGAKTAVSGIAIVMAAAGPFMVGLNSIISAGSQLHAIFGKLPTGMIKAAAGAKWANTLSIAFKGVPADALSASNAISGVGASSEKMATGASKAATAAESAAAGAAGMAGSAGSAASGAEKAAAGAEKMATGAEKASIAADGVARNFDFMAEAEARTTDEWANVASAGDNAAQATSTVADSSGKAASSMENAATGASNMAGSTQKAGTNAAKAATGAEKMASGASKAAGAAEKAAAGAMDVSTSAGKMASNAGKAAAGVENMTQKMSLAARAGSIFKTSIAMIGIAAAIAVISGLADAYMKYKERAEDAAKASEDMSDRMARAAGVAKDSMSQLGKTDDIKSGKEVLKEYYDYLSDVADSYDQLQEKANETFTNVGLIENYADTIENLLKKTEAGAVLNPQEQAQLSAAVDAFNDAAGTSISVTDAEHGKLEDLEGQVYETADAFDKLADSKKFAALQDYANEEYATAYENQLNATKNLAEAEKTLVDERSKLSDMEKQSKEDPLHFDMQAYNEQVNAVHDAEDAVSGYKKAVEDANVVMDQSSDLQSLMALAASENATAIDRLVADSPEMVATFQANGQSAMDFVDALDSMGDAAQNLSADQVQELAESWDGSMESILPKLKEYGLGLENLNSIKIGDQDFYVTDNGTIYDSEGKLREFDQLQVGDKTYYVDDQGTVWDETSRLDNLAMMTIGDKSYIVSDNGTIGGELADLQGLKSTQVDNKTYWVSDDGSVYDETGKIMELSSVDIANKFVHVDDDGTNAQVQDEIRTTKSNLDSVPGTTKTTISQSGASLVNLAVSSVKTNLDNLDGKTASVYINKYVTTYKKTEGGKASGGIAPTRIYPRNARGGLVPAHADGGINGIVTRATLTNVGWVGEAGAEAVLNMRHAGGAIVPLSNRHYVRPFAQAVASEMGGGSGDSITTTNVYIDGARVNDDSHVEALFYEFMTYLHRKAAMNVG